MSDAVDNWDFYAEQLLKKSKTNMLRQQMQEYVSEYGSETDLKALRSEGLSGKNLSELVKNDREERL